MNTKKRVRKLHRATLRRDLSEAAATGLVLAVFGTLAMAAPGILPKVGFVVAVPLLFAPIVRLFAERRRHKRLGADVPITSFLQAEMDKVDGQITLLGTVDRWYLRPLTWAAVILMATLAASIPVEGNVAIRAVLSLGAAAFSFLLFVPVRRVLVATNRREVQRVLLPLRKELAQALDRM